MTISPIDESQGKAARVTEASPRSLARLAGVFQLLEAVTATFGQVIVVGWLVVPGNASATADKILGNERLFWFGFASCLIGIVCHIAWALLVYDLLKRVHRRLSLFAVFVILVGCAIQALTSVFYLAPLLVLTGGSSVSAFTTEQLHALAFLFVRLNAYAFDTYLVFFGLWCVLIGLLIFRSTFLPRILGVLFAISGLGYLTFLSPPLANYLFFPYIAAAVAPGEISVMLWFLVFGVNARRWKAHASYGGHFEKVSSSYFHSYFAGGRIGELCSDWQEEKRG